MSTLIKMTCVHSEQPEWFTVTETYDTDIRDECRCICGDNLVSDLNKPDWYEMSQRADGLWFMAGYQQSVLFQECAA